eukprot:5634921-Ditylum_brightwellii.AAC.1
MMRMLWCHVNTLKGERITLNLLWWEWPQSQWSDLLYSIPGNFMTYLSEKLTPNPPMTKEQWKVAAAFVDELVDIGAVQSILEGSKLYANGLLKVIPKPGQPGKWRVLSDMQKGGQNNHITSHLTHNL